MKTTKTTKKRTLKVMSLMVARILERIGNQKMQWLAHQNRSLVKFLKWGWRKLIFGHLFCCLIFSLAVWHLLFLSFTFLLPKVYFCFVLLAFLLRFLFFFFCSRRTLVCTRGIYIPPLSLRHPLTLKSFDSFTKNFTNPTFLRRILPQNLAPSKMADFNVEIAQITKRLLAKPEKLEKQYRKELEAL